MAHEHIRPEGLGEAGADAVARPVNGVIHHRNNRNSGARGPQTGNGAVESRGNSRKTDHDDIRMKLLEVALQLGDCGRQGGLIPVPGKPIGESVSRRQPPKIARLMSTDGPERPSTTNEMRWRTESCAEDATAGETVRLSAEVGFLCHE